ncbi:endonuclease/exonuclease/phosphatase family protein [Pseudomonas sp. B14-6]|uniref:endonuclease/exonuclease/phosphatase family protein n=1 Tax=Pseudomonas sp. B14-6 TaxID=2738843 RepID=UPI001C4983E3|nr:endonuclease/exonuclease/phosphatase family protein [Pseudomonas sp. B14-6]
MKSYRVASFNVENLLHPGVYYTGRDDSAPYDGALFDQKIRWIGSILDEARADLVGFQEVFSYEAIKSAVAASRHLNGAMIVAPGIEAGENIRPRAAGGMEASGPNLALASRFPVLSAEAITDFPATVNLTIPLELNGVVKSETKLNVHRFERPILKARVTLPGGVNATVLVAHLKSKRPKFLEGENPADPVVQALGRIRSLIVRSMEAVALRAIVVNILDNLDGEVGEPLILFGDLNDDVSSVTTQTVAGEEPAQFLRPEIRRRDWDIQLYSVHDLQEALSYRDVSYTHIYNGRHELLDHIFVSQEFVRQFPQRLAIVANTRIFNDHLLDKKWVVENDRPSIIIDGKRMWLPSLRSDHGVPVTEIEIVAPLSTQGEQTKG